MYANPFDRKFGIEFEFGLNLPATGPHTYGSDNRDWHMKNILEECGVSDFRIGHDGTEWEIKTPPLSGPNGFKKVKRFLEGVLDRGAFVTDSDGLHVHHDAPEFIDEPLRTLTLVENWVENQAEIMKMVHRNRNGRWACPPWSIYDVDRFKQNIESNVEEPSQGFGRKNLNVSALRRHGTIEVRLHEGTLNYEEVLSWVRFGQSFIGKALNETENRIEPEPSVESLLRTINVSRFASRFLTSKVTNSGRTTVSVNYL